VTSESATRLRLRIPAENELSGFTLPRPAVDSSQVYYAELALVLVSSRQQILCSDLASVRSTLTKNPPTRVRHTWTATV
jgi:hypothetical protein